VFPGPKLAALTLWYEFYYDVIKGGKYTWEIGRMHEKYGLLQHFELSSSDTECRWLTTTSRTNRADKPV
jgi:hypothetical protein